MSLIGLRLARPRVRPTPLPPPPTIRPASTPARTLPRHQDAQRIDQEAQHVQEYVRPAPRPKALAPAPASSPQNLGDPLRGHGGRGECQRRSDGGLTPSFVAFWLCRDVGRAAEAGVSEIRLPPAQRQSQWSEAVADRYPPLRPPARSATKRGKSSNYNAFMTVSSYILETAAAAPPAHLLRANRPCATRHLPSTPPLAGQAGRAQEVRADNGAPRAHEARSRRMEGEHAACRLSHHRVCMLTGLRRDRSRRASRRSTRSPSEYVINWGLRKSFCV